jgi:hypothetical protein
MGTLNCIFVRVPPTLIFLSRFSFIPAPHDSCAIPEIYHESILAGTMVVPLLHCVRASYKLRSKIYSVSTMATLQQQIADKFLSALAQREEVDADKVVELRKLLDRGKKPKAEEFIQVFTAPPGGEIK